MKRRKTVSVTPAIGASTVAGEISTPPIRTKGGTGVSVRAAPPAARVASRLTGSGFSQYLRTILFYSSAYDFIRSEKLAIPAPEQGLTARIPHTPGLASKKPPP